MAAVIAIDPGQHYIGIAVSDPERRLASPIAVVAAKPRLQFLGELHKIMQERAIDQIIVGRPLSLKHGPLPMTGVSEEFARWLTQQTKVPVALVDERLSTKEAEKLQASGGRVDASAAAIFLQTYLDRANHVARG